MITLLLLLTLIRIPTQNYDRLTEVYAYQRWQDRIMFSIQGTDKDDWYYATEKLKNRPKVFYYTVRQSILRPPLITIEERTNFVYIKNLIEVIGLHIDFYNQAPEYNRLRITKLLLKLEKYIHKDNRLKKEIEDRFMQPIVALGIEIKRNGLSQDALDYYQRLQKVYREMYSKERLLWRNDRIKELRMCL